MAKVAIHMRSAMRPTFPFPTVEPERLIGHTSGQAHAGHDADDAECEHPLDNRIVAVLPKYSLFIGLCQRSELARHVVSHADACAAPNEVWIGEPSVGGSGPDIGSSGKRGS